MTRVFTSMVLCLVLAGGPFLAGCSDGAEDRKADCAKISSALAKTPDPTADQVLDALRAIRPGLKDDDLAEQVDTVLASGGKDTMSDEETFRFARATEEIRSTCRRERAALSG
ncbi:hypothetical protein ETD83_24035 [Actinomadura soli]|uniref:Lipoprotein n=1 Tax=Actinomadura soli TaxID=2508997 RepID=A0A5C4J7M8_9ACTN|nr:hypothetical protein [Actinomadura soli]TMQ94394.1 hypothetical protein ETD83_24035 [Actinomadura soli]